LKNILHNPSTKASCPQKALFASRGFTLVEVLLSLWIMSIMALMSWQSIDGMVRVRERSLSSVSELSLAQTAMAQWQTDLDQAYGADTNTQLPGLDWDGQTLKMVRSSTAPWDSSGDPGLWVVAWTIRARSAEDLSNASSPEPDTGLYWMRWQSPAFKTQAELGRYWQAASSWGKNPSPENKAFETLLMPLQNWQLYYYRLNAWSNPLSSSDPTGMASTNNSSSNAASTTVGGTANLDQSNSSTSTSTNANANANNSSLSQNTGFPDGVRLKLFLNANSAWGAPSSNPLTQSPASALTLDWIRPNFSSVR
jgi:general secretion pathway protein J